MRLLVCTVAWLLLWRCYLLMISQKFAIASVSEPYHILFVRSTNSRLLRLLRLFFLFSWFRLNMWSIQIVLRKVLLALPSHMIRILVLLYFERFSHIICSLYLWLIYIYNLSIFLSSFFVDGCYLCLFSARWNFLTVYIPFEKLF